MSAESGARRKADRQQRKADKRKRTDDEHDDTDQQPTNQLTHNAHDSSAARQSSKTGKQRTKKDNTVESEEAEEEHKEQEVAREVTVEEEEEQQQEQSASKPKVAVKKTSEGDEYIDVRPHVHSTTRSCSAHCCLSPMRAVASCRQLSYKRRVAVRQFRGSLLVDLRETYEKFGEMQPGKTGIALNLEQWAKLKASVHEIDAMIARRK